MKYDLTVDEFLNLLERADLEPVPHVGRGLKRHSPGVVTELPMSVLPLLLEVALSEWTTFDGGPDELIPWLEALVAVVKDSRVDVVNGRPMVYWPAYSWPVDPTLFLAPEDPVLAALDAKLRVTP